MSALRQVAELLQSFSRAGKAQLLRLVSQELDEAFPGIDSTPGVCGGEACIVRTRVPVWSLEQLFRLGASEDELLRSYPALRAEDPVNAWSYVRAHHTEIEDGSARTKTPEINGPFLIRTRTSRCCRVVKLIEKALKDRCAMSRCQARWT
jgi:uncharacterized protein (DUF433 family)